MEDRNRLYGGSRICQQGDKLIVEVGRGVAEEKKLERRELRWNGRL